VLALALVSGGDSSAGAGSVNSIEVRSRLNSLLQNFLPQQHATRGSGESAEIPQIDEMDGIGAVGAIVFGSLNG